MILIIVLLNAQEKNDIISDKDRSTWDSLSADEKWESFKIEHNSYVRLSVLYDKKDKREDILIKDLEKSTSLLENMQPKNGLEVSGIFGIDYDKKHQEIGFDSYVFLNYSRCYYLGPVQAYIEVGAGVKFFENYGGAVSLGLGFKFK